MNFHFRRFLQHFHVQTQRAKASLSKRLRGMRPEADFEELGLKTQEFLEVGDGQKIGSTRILVVNNGKLC